MLSAIGGDATATAAGAVTAVSADGDPTKEVRDIAKTVNAAGNYASNLATTAHGAERLAGEDTTRGGVLAADKVASVMQAGRLMTANNDKVDGTVQW